jgi:hypothetical protein
MSSSHNVPRRLFYVLLFCYWGLFAAAAFVALLLTHHTVFTATFVGLAWGILPQGLAWGLADLIAPRWTHEWSERLSAPMNDWRKTTGTLMLVSIGVSDPTTGLPILRRLRIMGAALTVFWLATAALLLWIPSPMDTLWELVGRVR